MKLLVTGGAGFIGSNFIRYWFKNHSEDSIRNLDKLTYAGHLSSTKDFSENNNYEFIKGDICDGQVVEKAMDGIDIVVHFAAESHVDRSIVGPQEFIKTNVLGTQILLAEALKKGVKKFHHVSTDEVFGALSLESTEKFSENTVYNPRSPYSASKAGSDHLVRAYFQTFGLPITITNCSNNFGPFQDPEKLFARSITNLLSGQPVNVYGDGLNVRDWLFVEDHARAIEKVLMEGKVGETYLVGGLTEEISNLDVVKRMIKIMGKDESQIKFVKDRPGHDRKYSVDWSKINKELGWEPKGDFNSLLNETIVWYKENEWWWKPLKEEAEKLYDQTGQK
jgi:dTDP-glucose 4,6-dehydratase